MSALSAAVVGAARAWALLGGLVVASIVLVTSLNVGAWALDSALAPLGWSVEGLTGYEDYVRLAVSAGVLMFFPWCQWRRGHVAVDLFVRHLPHRLQRALDWFTQSLIVAVALFLGGWMAVGMMETRADHALSRVLAWPEWPFYLPGTLSMFLWALVALIQFSETDG